MPIKAIQINASLRGVPDEAIWAWRRSSHPAKRASSILLALLLTLTAHAQDNLLANPGFEDLAGSMPARWDVFVQPSDGATGRLVDDAHTGKLAVQLQISQPYEQDPANNWSQSVLGEFGGKKMRLSGHIKVQDAEDATIWAQCWRKAPRKVVHIASTNQRAPVYGTKDWDEAFIEFDVPQNTDFIVVRCVIKGTGTAWFDDISLTVVGEAPKKPLPPDVSPPMPKETTDTPTPSEAALKSDMKDGLKGYVREQIDLKRLEEENKLLRRNLDTQKETNRLLEERIRALEEKLGGE
jgi:hypothetical protein